MMTETSRVTAVRTSCARRRGENLSPALHPTSAIGRPVANQKRLPQMLQIEVIITIDGDDALDERIEAGARPYLLFCPGEKAVHPTRDALRETRLRGRPQRMRRVRKARQ